MNCFETRNGFGAFWRRTLAPESRTALVSHLSECAGCDRAFRVFALTAPLLYSDTTPAGRGIPSRRRESRPATIGRRSENPRRAWRALCAMAVMIFAAGFAAYLAAAVPRQTLDDAFSNPEPAGDLTGQEELQVSFNDLAR